MFCEKFLVFVMMVKLGVARAHLYPNPCSCRLVGLMMVLWVLGLLIFVCD